MTHTFDCDCHHCAPVCDGSCCQEPTAEEQALDAQDEAQRVDDDKPCACGHALYLHDDGTAACLDCECKRFGEAQ